MSVGLMTSEQRQEMKSVVKAWKMPRPRRGQCVLYYHRGVVSPGNCDIGFVCDVHERMISVTLRGTKYTTVYFIKDPRLDLNPDLRHEVDGLWSFNEHDLEVAKRLDELEDRLEQLTAELKEKTFLSSRGVPAKSTKKNSTVED